MLAAASSPPMKESRTEIWPLEFDRGHQREDKHGSTCSSSKGRNRGSVNTVGIYFPELGFEIQACSNLRAGLILPAYDMFAFLKFY